VGSSSTNSRTDLTMGSLLFMSTGRGRNECRVMVATPSAAPHRQPHACASTATARRGCGLRAAMSVGRRGQVCAGGGGGGGARGVRSCEARFRVLGGEGGCCRV
jgi:hypothetical protein